jgi:hypothetical protein
MTESSMMQLTRLAGALLLAGDGAYFLIGNTKEPCDWNAAGFHAPTEVEAGAQTVRRLELAGMTHAGAPALLTIRTDGQTVETIAEILANRFLIRRSASVSERLWRLVTGVHDESSSESFADTDATWLVRMPERVWDVVRDAALKCL